MRLDSVLSLKKELKEEISSEEVRITGLKAESVDDDRPAQRLALGYSNKGRNDYRLEIRIQRDDGPASRMAEKVVHRASGECNVETVEEVRVPTLRRLRENLLEGGPLRQERRPLCIGASVSHCDGGAGTLGAFVARDDRDMILSNAHVLALSGRADKGDPIYQPGRPDVKQLISDGRVAKLERSIDVAKGEANYGDAAVAAISAGVKYEGNSIPKGCGFPNEGKRIKLGREVILGNRQSLLKIGRSTELTRGEVSAMGLDGITVLVSGIGNIVFDNLVEVEPAETKSFTEDGDSGSLVFTEDFEAVGLHFAGGPTTRNGKSVKVSYACNLETVLDILGVKWL